MIEGREHLGFTLKSSQAFGISGEGVGEDLQRDVTTELRVVRLIDLAHAPGTDGRETFRRGQGACQETAA